MPVLTLYLEWGVLFYVQYCLVCHGDIGLGDGLVGIGLELLLVNLRDVVCLDWLSFYDLYNIFGLGIEGTDMLVFADQFDDRQRWDLAVYIAGFTVALVQGQASFVMSELAGRMSAEIAVAGGDVAAFCVQCVHLVLE